MQNALLALERVIKQLDALPKIQDKENAKLLKGIENSIEFKNVNFEYKKNKPVFKKTYPLQFKKVKHLHLSEIQEEVKVPLLI